MTFEDAAFFWQKGLKRTHQILVWSNAFIHCLICGTPLITTIRHRISERMATQWPSRSCLIRRNIRGFAHLTTGIPAVAKTLF